MPSLASSAELNQLLMPDDRDINDSSSSSFNDSMVVTPWVEYNDNLSSSTRSHVQPRPIDIIAEYYPVAFAINSVLPYVCYAIGFLGNTISAVAWLQPRLSRLNSSAVYLALLSINDLIFLVLHCAAQVNTLLDVRLFEHAGICEIYMFLFVVPQYLTPLLVLGFTAERYVAICHPLLRRVLCRTRIAICVSVAMTLSSVLLSSIQPLFWTYSPEARFCDLRQSVPNIDLVWFYWSTVVETLMFLVVPAAMLVLDVLVIRRFWQIHRNPLSSARGRAGTLMACQKETGGKAVERGDGGGSGGGDGRTRKIGVALVEPLNEDAGPGEAVEGSGGGGGIGGRTGRGGGFVVAGVEMREGRGGGEGIGRSRASGSRVPYQATTALLLSVSLFEIVTIVSVSILYLLHDQFRKGPAGLSKEEMLADPTWQRYFPYLAAKFIVLSLCMTRHAALIFFYFTLGPRFRETLWDLVRCQKPSTRPRAGLTFAGSSVSSVRSQHHVEQAMRHRTSSSVVSCDV